MRVLAVFFVFLLSFQSYAQSQKIVNISDTFPVPKITKDLLFYIQRTHNKNTIMYTLNYNADSTINEKEPVKIFWIRYSDKGEVAPLSYIQRNYAYGIESQMTDATKKTFKLNLVSYKKRTIYLMRSEVDKQYHAYVMMDNKLVYLFKAFAKIDGGTFWVPHITYVELTGKDSMTGKKIIEKIIP
ncbi:DUF4833 domain-containing protein [Sphingobacteriaceae bacterium]|nr:DUF4833 domain-containing protein [Sphingobacteriaceae bacterium]